jgi:hypothetical protein
MLKRVENTEVSAVTVKAVKVQAHVVSLPKIVPTQVSPELTLSKQVDRLQILADHILRHQREMDYLMRDIQLFMPHLDQ